MAEQLWSEILLPPGDKDQVWELFHENSKIGRDTRSLSEEDVAERMRELHESLPFDGYPIVDLPRSFKRMKLSLEDAIISRSSSRDLARSSLDLEDLAAVLHYAYGVTRSNIGTGFLRPFRVVPSGGALYPLEIFLHTACTRNLQSGLYHYNPAKHRLRQLHRRDESKEISELLVQPNVALSASLVVFITALFERSTFKYGDRGYRFAFLEAGHVAQNINLICNGLGLGCLNIGGYFDREVDRFLNLDGVTHSTIYMIAIGAKGQENALEPMP